MQPAPAGLPARPLIPCSSWPMGCRTGNSCSREHRLPAPTAPEEVSPSSGRGQARSPVRDERSHGACLDLNDGDQPRSARSSQFPEKKEISGRRLFPLTRSMRAG